MATILRFSYSLAVEKRQSKDPCRRVPDATGKFPTPQFSPRDAPAPRQSPFHPSPPSLPLPSNPHITPHHVLHPAPTPRTPIPPQLPTTQPHKSHRPHASLHRLDPPSRRRHRHRDTHTAGKHTSPGCSEHGIFAGPGANCTVGNGGGERRAAVAGAAVEREGEGADQGQHILGRPRSL